MCNKGRKAPEGYYYGGDMRTGGKLMKIPPSAEELAAIDANVSANQALAASRRRRRIGSMIVGGRTVLGAPSGGRSTALAGGGGSVGIPTTPSRGSAV